MRRLCGMSAKTIVSLDGDVKLWDLRHTHQAMNAWAPQPNGLAAFDVHPTTRVFASSVDDF